MHLHMVEKLLDYPEIEPLRPLLINHLPAFSFGNIAPDFQAICEVKRDVTHFYPIPPQKGDYNAFGRLLETEPHLGNPEQLSLNQAVFTAGYGTHLLFDLIWDHNVLTPHFRNAEWAEPLIRYLAHNIMLTYLDREAQAHLTRRVTTPLNKAPIPTILSFASIENLQKWHNTITEQLQPDAISKTVTIYAKRMQMTAQEFIDRLNDPEWMDEHVFQRVSWDLVQSTIDSAIPRAIPLLQSYLAPLIDKYPTE